MLKKSLWVAGSLVLLVFAAVMVYGYYFQSPSPFPAKKQLISKINKLFPEAAASKIQDTIPLDKKHVFVPYISKGDKHGTSSWAWNQRKWELESINTTGEPQLWKINLDDPETFYFTWNMDPESKLGDGKFYMLRDRGFFITDGKENYLPRIQMEKDVSFQTKPYGVLKIPREWVVVMNSFIDQGTSKNDQLNFGWVPYDTNNKVLSPKDLIGNGFSNYGDHIEMVRFLDKDEIE
ncbi:hypothetical protein ACT8ZR_23405 [Neobacillus sp. M.A.Huq-85]